MRPWESGGGPDEGELRAWVAAEWTDRQIGERCGFSEQAAAYYRRKYGVTRPGVPVMGNRKKYLPWTVAKADHNDGIARALRAMSRVEDEGDNVPLEVRRQAEKLASFLRDEDVVVHYEWGVGFSFVPRDPAVDAPGDIVRRPDNPTQ